MLLRWRNRPTLSPGFGRYCTKRCQCSLLSPVSDMNISSRTALRRHPEHIRLQSRLFTASPVPVFLLQALPGCGVVAAIWYWAGGDAPLVCRCARANWPRDLSCLADGEQGNAPYGDGVMLLRIMGVRYRGFSGAAAGGFKHKKTAQGRAVRGFGGLPHRKVRINAAETVRSAEPG